MAYCEERELRRSNSDPSFASDNFNYANRGKNSKKDNGQITSKIKQFQTAQEGRKLFTFFLEEEIKSQGFKDLQIPEHLLAEEETKEESLEFSLKHPHGFKTPQWSETGQKLRKLADEFARSNARKEVFHQAEEVNIQTLGKEEFFQLLNELFQGGISRERIIALFFFCSDLVIRVLRQSKLRYFSQFVGWSLSFISNGISQWVLEHGGWGAVLSSSIRYATMISVIVASLAVTIAVVFYVKKNK